MRTVVISHNRDPQYSFFEPIVKWAWNKLGWEVLCLQRDSVIESQCIRLYAGELFTDNRMLMTSDIDMLPLSDYWNPEEGMVTCYGRNLSKEHYPICYIAMNADLWYSTMGDRDCMKEDIAKAGSRWTTDQDIITERLNKMCVTKVHRGIDPLTGYPIGRVDRSAWNRSLEQPFRIDAHLLRPGYTDENWPKIISLIQECLSPTNSDLDWLNYHRLNYLK